MTIYLHPSNTSGARAAEPNIQSGALPKKMADLENELEKLNLARDVTEDDKAKKMKELAEALKRINPGRDVTAETTANCDDTTLRNKAMAHMVKTLPLEQQTRYHQCNNDEERYQWAAAYILDPKKVKCQGATSVSTRVTTKFSEKTMWITADELDGPSHLNSKAHAEIAIAHLMSRPHENVALAAAGIKQYKWIVKATWRTSIEEETRAQSSRSET